MLKDKLYNYFVRTNGRVWYEYERYVREHMEEHRLHRLKHLRILLKLNWFYRVKKGNTPYLYWDEPLIPIKKKSIATVSNPSMKKTEKVIPKGNNLIYPEIGTVKRKSISELVELFSDFEIISFDIFDTLIFRYLNDPKDVFNLVGIRLGVYDYKAIRISAEEEARKNVDDISNEVCLSDICSIASLYSGIDVSKCVEEELDVERQVCFANPYIYEIARQLAEKGKRIIATSNMYLDSIQLGTILTACGYDFISEIFVSCEYKKSKYQGELQKCVWSNIGKDKKVIHIGDNYIVDYIGSRMAGWKAYYYQNVNDIGNVFRPAKMSKLAFSFYSGIVNSHFHNGMVNESMYYELGFAYLGILVVGFCEWINDYAKRESVDKILFTSRDMYVVHEIYNEFFNEVDNDYVKISRFCSQRYSYNRFSNYFIDSHIKARAQIEKLTIHEVLEELDITFLEDYLARYELDKDELFTMKLFPKLKKLMNENKQVILNEFGEEKEACKEYYSQFVSKNQKVAVVDLGWQGTNALCLKYLLEELDMNLGVKSLLLASCSPRDYVSIAYSSGVSEAYCFSMNHNEQLCNQFSGTRMGRFICELIFSSNEKSLKRIAYDEQGNIVFSYIDNEIRNEGCMDDIFRGAKDFVSIWKKANVFNDLRLSGFDAILPLNKLSYNNICFKIMDGNEINPWIGETKREAASDIRKIVK